MLTRHRRPPVSLIVLVGLVASLTALASPGPSYRPAHAQPEDCGVVTAIDFPVPVSEDRGDDFAIYRARFGGLHTGVDVAFYQYGDPVHAVADGRVTYANPVGWDTEKGVVILEHVFPDGNRFYSLYGHMEPIGDYFFPGIGQCVRMGDIVGAVGSPTLSAPHLHFEIRDFGPDDGGPGYWDENPLLAGWEHPLDFIRRWQAQLQFADVPQAETRAVSALNPPGVPPLVTPDDGLIMASANTVEGIAPDGDLDWRMELSGTVAGMVLLPDGRVLLRTASTGAQSGDIQLLQDGRYTAIWTPPFVLTEGPRLLANGLVAFVTGDNTLAAFTPEGALRWATPPLGERPGNLITDGQRLAVRTDPRAEDSPPAWHVFDQNGVARYQVATANPVFAALSPGGSAFVLDGATLYHISPEYVPAVIARLPAPAGRSTALTTDSADNVYVFTALDEATLTSYAADGTRRWALTLPGTHRQPPLLQAGGDCLFYLLAADGTLYALDRASGEILGETRLYAGGRNGQPNARLLDVRPQPEGAGETVQFGAGFLSVLSIEGHALAGLAPGTCPS
ncbi:MAG: hypothetical protein Kow0077_08730 [Anaerolineae bacterium]